MNVQDLLAQADVAFAADAKARSDAGLGTWRVGSGGIYARIDGVDQVVGTCPRKALARSLGIEQPIPANRLHMFAAGVSNEDVFCKNLAKCLPAEFKILREEECPISWQTKAGTTVSGRPDVVVCDSDSKPLVGIELKMVCSVWTAKSVAFDFEPKSSAVIQAAHYADKLGVPYELYYTSPVQYVVPDWAAKKGFFDPQSEFVELNEKGNIKSILPFRVGYDIVFNGDECFYAKHGSSEWKATIITKSNSEKYFDLLDSCKSMKRLGPRPSTYSCFGKKEGFDVCDAKYCEWSHCCDRFEGSWDAWFQAVKKISR